MNNIVCYTCITKEYDQLNDPIVVDPKIDYICFSDLQLSSQTWKILPIPDSIQHLSKVKQQRIIKLCPHRYLPSNYDISIWVDGNILVKGSLIQLLSEYDLDSIPFYTRIHPFRNCIYDEAKAVIDSKRDDSTRVNEIMQRYNTEGFPHKFGLAETNVLIRKHNTSKCYDIDEMWASELLLNSHRDQLSFNYVCWKQNFTPGYMTNQFEINNNEYFSYKCHQIK